MSLTLYGTMNGEMILAANAIAPKLGQSLNMLFMQIAGCPVAARMAAYLPTQVTLTQLIALIDIGCLPTELRICIQVMWPYVAMVRTNEKRFDESSIIANI